MAGSLRTRKINYEKLTLKKTHKHETYFLPWKQFAKKKLHLLTLIRKQMRNPYALVSGFSKKVNRNRETEEPTYTQKITEQKRNILCCAILTRLLYLLGDLRKN